MPRRGPQFHSSAVLPRMRNMLVFIWLLFPSWILAQPNADEVFVRVIFARLLSAPSSMRQPKYASWPPNVAILSSTRDGKQVAQENALNAFSAAPDCQPVVRISQGLLDQVVQGDSDRAALILGHELAHLVLGHVPCTQGEDATAMVQLTLRREEEYAADAKGYELALQAGFSVRSGLIALQRLEEISNYSSFEALGTDHPSWADRLSRLDSDKAPVWRSMSAFSDGVYFLATENYDLAAECFDAVEKEFPQAADATANLGYARLMQYLDGMRAENLRSLGIGQLATGSFYVESAHLKRKIRGIDVALWNEAVRTLKRAEALDPELALVKANLGLAYLVKPTGSDPQQAVNYLETAASMLKSDSVLSSQSDTAANLAVKAVVNNLAVAYLAAGSRDKGEELLASLWEVQGKAVDVQSLLQLTAIYYNVGTMLAESSDASERAQAASILESYLRSAPSSSAWWSLAYAKYAQVCSAAQSGCVTEVQFKSNPPTIRREVAAVTLAGNKTVRLGESMDTVFGQIGQGQQLSGVPGTNLRRMRYSQHSMDVIGTDVVVAIMLNGKNAPELAVRGLGAGSTKAMLRCGMTAAEVERTLAGEPYRQEGLVDTWIPYRLYPALGVAIRMGATKTVEELVVVRSPP